MPSSDYCSHGKFWRCEQCDIEDAQYKARRSAREEHEKESEALYVEYKQFYEGVLAILGRPDLSADELLGKVKLLAKANPHLLWTEKQSRANLAASIAADDSELDRGDVD